MNCRLDLIKSNRLVVSSLVIAGLTAVGAVAHRLGLLILCSKALSTACGHIVTVVQRHRFVSTVLALGVIGSVVVAAVLRSKKSERSNPSQSERISSPTSSSTDTQQIKKTPSVANYGLFNCKDEGEFQNLIDDRYYPAIFETHQEKWSPNFGTIEREVVNELLQKMIETVLSSYLKGEEIPFCEFFNPAYLTIKPQESNQAQSAMMQSDGSTSIFPIPLQTQRKMEYGDLLQAIILYYFSEADAEIPSGATFSYRFEITVGDEKVVSIGTRNLVV